MTTMTENYLDIAKEVFQDEIETLNLVVDNLGDEFNKAIEIMFNCKGRVLVVGMGKSGHIGAKIAATLASTGTPSFFCHPAEMGHGDLGMLKPDDVVLGLSFSGNTEELRKVLAPIKKVGVPLVSITGNKESTLAEFSEVVLHTPITKEACPLNLAPTSSTTASLVIGDALAVALMKKRDFKKEDFALSHPLGSLGKSLTMVSDVMRIANDLPKVKGTDSLDNVLKEITDKKLGLTTVLNDQGSLIGTITDGDLRRAQISYNSDLHSKTAEEIMSKDPKTINQSKTAVSATKIMDDNRISDVIVVDDDNKPIGIVDLKDLLKAGLL